MITMKRAPHKGRWDAVPLTWWPTENAAGGKSAVVACANGHASSITNHRILDDGTVDPSIVCCPKGGCNWHEHATLEGWTA